MNKCLYFEKDLTSTMVEVVWFGLYKRPWGVFGLLGKLGSIKCKYLSSVWRTDHASAGPLSEHNKSGTVLCTAFLVILKSCTKLLKYLVFSLISNINQIKAIFSSFFLYIHNYADPDPFHTFYTLSTC